MQDIKDAWYKKKIESKIRIMCDEKRVTKHVQE